MSYIRYQTVDQKIQQIDYTDDKAIDLSRRKIQRIIKIIGFTDLEYLNLSSNQITRIEGFDSLTALQHLNLSNNQITRIEGMDNLTALQHLNLSNNKITRIEGMDNLTALQKLYLSNNKITHIEGFDSLTALQKLYLSNNKIIRIEGMDNLTALQLLNLDDNQITRIEGLNNLTALRMLNLICNQITRIEGLDCLTSLNGLYLNSNPIKEVPITIMLLTRLWSLDVDTEFDQIIMRFLHKNQIKTNRTVYDDAQNVHNSQISRSIAQSLYRLMEQKIEISEENVINEILSDLILTNQVKEQLIEYIRITDVHSLLNVTFSEAFRVVWQIIRTHKECDEIKRILNHEMQDSLCKCFTGRLSRMINCLNGFDSRVSVKISNQQEIANLIIAIRQKTNSLAEQQQMVHHEMTERGYDGETIREWIGYLE
jgi:hypothetical protein